MYTVFVGDLEPNTLYYVTFSMIGEQNTTHEKAFATSTLFAFVYCRVCNFKQLAVALI